MHKLLLTLFAFSSGVLCNAARSVDPLGIRIDSTEDGNIDSAKHTQPRNVIRSFDPLGNPINSTEDFSEDMTPDSDSVLHDLGISYHPFSNTRDTCRSVLQLPSGYVAVPGMGAHKLYKENLKWNSARKACVAEGGQLAIIHSDAEAALLTILMKRENVPYVWIGVHNYFGDDEWVTLTGHLLKATSYDTWGPNQPDNKNGDENCMVLAQSVGLADARCKHQFNYICEVKLC